jgi:RNA polymerase sigma factor (sigma-70 family)
MDEQVLLADRFEEHRPHLRSVAYRMLSSYSEADDAVQEAWFRLSRSDTSGVENLGGWLTTVVSRICLDMLRSRRSRREDTLSVHLPDPVVTRVEASSPEERALMADSVGLAMLVVLETLAPAERVAFVLHDMFAVPYDEIAPIVGRSPDATRQVASRARRRVQVAAPEPDPDLARQREAVDAFFAAASRGDFEALVAVLDPDIVLRSDGGRRRALTDERHGAETVAKGALSYARMARELRPVLVIGVAGVLVTRNGKPNSVMAFTVRDGRIAAIDILADPDRLAQLDLPD